MERFAQSPSSDLSPTRGVRHLPPQEIISTQEINNKLRQSKEVWKMMERFGDLTEEHIGILSDLESKQVELQNAYMDAGASELTIELRKEFEELTRKEFRIIGDLDRLHETIDTEVFVPQEGDTPDIIDLIDQRSERKAEAETKKCSPLGYKMHYLQPLHCRRIDESTQIIESKILTKRCQEFWSNHSLRDFVSNTEFPYPGYFQFNGAYVDVKSIVDGARHIATIEEKPSPETEALIAFANLSRINLGRGGHIIFDEYAVRDAQELAHLIDARDFQHNAHSIYSFHKKFGELLDYDERAIEQEALKRARKIDPDFIP